MNNLCVFKTCAAATSGQIVHSLIHHESIRNSDHVRREHLETSSSLSGAVHKSLQLMSLAFLSAVQLPFRNSRAPSLSPRRRTLNMVRTTSKTLSSNTVAPDFALLEPLTGKTVTLQEARDAKGILVVFMCNHCPFVMHLKHGLADAGKKAKELGIGMVGISSNDVDNYPADSPEKMKDMAATVFTTFKYLYDPTQKVALDYNAVCTPDIFLFDGNLKLFYQ